MDCTSYNEIYDKMKSLELSLILPLRTSKSINRKAFDELYSILDDFVEVSRNDNFIPKRVAGLLVQIYISIDAEAYHTKYPDPIFVEAAKIESYMMKIFPYDTKMNN